MNILLIGDKPSKYLWDFYEEGRLKDIDLILSSGDLPAEYLSFLVTFASCPLLYVRGNHDETYGVRPPEGCICIEDTIFEYRGLRILGLGGSMRYRDGDCQYTEREMDWRIRKLWFSLRRKKGFDILLTHAPARALTTGRIFPPGIPVLPSPSGPVPALLYGSRPCAYGLRLSDSQVRHLRKYDGGKLL